MSVLRVTPAGGVQPAPVMAKAIEVAEDVFGRLNTALSWTFEVEWVRIVEAFDDTAEVIANVLDVNGDDVGRVTVWFNRDSDLDPSEVHLRLDVDGAGPGGQVLSQAVWDRFTCPAGAEHETGNGVAWCHGECGEEESGRRPYDIPDDLRQRLEAVTRGWAAENGHTVSEVRVDAFERSDLNAAAAEAAREAAAIAATQAAADAASDR